MEKISPNKPLVLFDGNCTFCNSWVQRLLKWDQKKQLRFAPLQSDTGQKIQSDYHIPQHIDSIIFYDGEACYWEGKALFQLVNYLGGLWRLFNLFRIVPIPLVNAVYRIIAKNRYKWFGQSDHCLIPTPEQRRRIIED